MITAKNIILVVFFLAHFNACASDNPVAKLLSSPPNLNGSNDIQKLKDYRVKLEGLNCCQYLLRNKPPKSSRSFYQKAFELAKNNDATSLALFYRALDLCSLSYGHNVQFSFEGQLFLKEEANLETPLSLAIAQGLVSQFIGLEEYENALEAIDLYDEIKAIHKNRFERFYDFSIAHRPLIFYRIGKYDKALSLYIKKLKELKDKYGACEISGLYHDVGLCYDKLNQSDSANIYYQRGLLALEPEALKRPRVYRFFRAMISASINKKYIRLEEYDKVIPGLIELKKCALEFDEGIQIRSSLFQLAEIHYWQGDLGSADAYLDELSDYLQPEFRFKNSYYQNMLDLKAKIYLKEGQFNKADSLWNVLVELRESDKIARGEVISMSTLAKHSLRLKEKEVLEKKRIEEQQSRNLFISLIGLIAFFIIALLSIRAYVKNRRAKKQIARQNALLNESVDQKEMLLKEIHHRVKNNLQIMSGLLQIQSNASDDEQLKTILAHSRNRIHSISSIHQMLYQNTNIKEVNASEYFEKVMYQNLQIQDVRHKYKISADGILLNMDLAIPLGLILNEMITNSYKHAFPIGKEGEIKVSLSQSNGKFIFMYADSGKGMKKVNQTKNKSLGLRLIDMMTRQIDGELIQNTEDGVEYIITFH